MNSATLRNLGQAVRGFVEGFLILHGTFNLLEPTPVRDSLIAFAVCVALVAIYFAVGLNRGWVKRATD